MSPNPPNSSYTFDRKYTMTIFSSNGDVYKQTIIKHKNLQEILEESDAKPIN